MIGWYRNESQSVDVFRSNNKSNWSNLKMSLSFVCVEMFVYKWWIADQTHQLKLSQQKTSQQSFHLFTAHRPSPTEKRVHFCPGHFLLFLLFFLCLHPTRLFQHLSHHSRALHSVLPLTHSSGSSLDNCATKIIQVDCVSGCVWWWWGAAGVLMLSAHIHPSAQLEQQSQRLPAGSAPCAVP